MTWPDTRNRFSSVEARYIVSSRKVSAAALVHFDSQSSPKCPIRRIFTPTLGFVRAHFPTGDSNLRQIFSAESLKLFKNT